MCRVISINIYSGSFKRVAARRFGADRAAAFAEIRHSGRANQPAGFAPYNRSFATRMPNTGSGPAAFHGEPCQSMSASGCLAAMPKTSRVCASTHCKRSATSTLEVSVSWSTHASSISRFRNVFGANSQTSLEPGKRFFLPGRQSRCWPPHRHRPAA